MIGIAFRSHKTIKKILNVVVSMVPFRQYYWKIQYYWIFSWGNGIDEGTYSPNEMIHCIENLTEDEQAETFEMFGASLAAHATGCKSMEDYLEGTDEAAFVCYDSSWFEIYCKDETALLILAKVLLESGLCKDDRIDYITRENNYRTGF